MVDIDPLQTRDIADSRPLKDTDAQALYHANVAMFALAENQTEVAWMHSVRALQLSPGMSQLWVNIGAVYRHAGQHREAERSYLWALELDSSSQSAMNNLQVLYELEGREEEQARWARRVESYRAKNPYYYAWYGDSAAQEGDWRAARDYYQKAVELEPDDSRLLYALGYAHYKLREFSLASGFIRKAIKHATLRSDIDAYRLQLKTVEADQAAET